MYNLILVAIAILAVYIFVFRKKKSANRNDTGVSQKDTEFKDLDEDFFEKSQGRDVAPIVRVYASKDKVLIRSLLDSEGIPTYVGSDYINNLFPGVQLQGHSNTVVYIIADDRTRAKNVIEDYIRNLVSSMNPKIDAKAVDFLAMISALPTSLRQSLPKIIDG